MAEARSAARGLAAILMYETYTVTPDSIDALLDYIQVAGKEEE